MTSDNLPNARINDADTKGKRPRPAVSNSQGQRSPEEISSKKGRNIGPLLPYKLQQTPPSSTVTRIKRLNKRTPSPLKRSMSSQEGPTASSKLQGASPASKLQGNSRRKKSAISVLSYMACFVEQRKHIKLAGLEELTVPQKSPISIQKDGNGYEISKMALDYEDNSQSSNQFNLHNQAGVLRDTDDVSGHSNNEFNLHNQAGVLRDTDDVSGHSNNQFNLHNQAGVLRDTDDVSGHSKLDDPALSNEKLVDADLTCAPDLEEATTSPKEIPEFSGSGEVKMSLDVNVSRQRDPEVRDGMDSNSNCDSREPFEGNCIDQTGEKILRAASGEPKIVTISENGECDNNGKGLESGYTDGAGGSEKLLLCNGCNISCHQSSLTPSLTDTAPGVLHCPACVRHKEEFSRFVEYWVPALISNVQLEQYCEMLLSNALPLSSSSRSGPVGALRDILISIRKCCDHPYIADPNLQNLLTRDIQATEYLDVGIKASGKLVLLDKLLHELKKQNMRVLVLFQYIGGCLDNTGDILDDYLRQRFGADSYERVDGGVIRSRVMAALDMFNQIEQGRFVFLLENRACHPRIKLSSVDVVIIFDSDWNPINDLRNLQKLSLESGLKQVKVVRLYSSFTVEEKALICAKQGATWDSKLVSVNSSISQMLLMWGASYLINNLEEFHNKSKTLYISDSDQKFTKNVVQEFLTLLQFGREETFKSNCIIVKAQVGVAGYSTDNLLLSESSLQFESLESPHIFWSRLLDGKVPCWKYISASSQRNRKKVNLNDQFTDESGHAQKKDRRKRMNRSTTLPHEKPGAEEGMPASKKGIHISPRSSLPGKDCMLSPESRIVEQDERTKFIDAQRSLHLKLLQEILRLSEVVELSGDVRVVLEIFLDYVINNHQLPREPTTILQAFQLALCWTSASLLKGKMDRKGSLELSQRHLSYTCSREEADCVYMRLRDLKKSFLATLQCSELVDSSKAPELLTKVVKVNRSSTKPLQPAATSRDVSAERTVATSSAACSSSEVLTSSKARDDKQLNGCADNLVETVNMRPSFEMKRNGIPRDYEAHKALLEKSYSVEVAIVRLHLVGSKQTEKLEILKREHAKKLRELELDHPTAENHFQCETESFSVQGDRHSFERIAHPEENSNEIDSAPFQSTDQNTRINVHDVENGNSETSRARSATQALASKVSTKAASLLDEENETADSGSTLWIVEEASKELLDSAGRTRNRQENADSSNSCLGEIGFTKETSEEAVKAALPGAGEPLFSKENAENMASDDLLTSRTSSVGVLVEEPVALGSVTEGLSSAGAPGTSALPGVEALQCGQGRESPVGNCHAADYHTLTVCSADDQNHDGSGILLPDEAARVTTGNVPPTCQEEMMFPNPRFDSCEDLHHEVASTSECLLDSAPRLFPELSNEDGNGQNQEQLVNMLEREVEAPHPCNFTSSDMEDRNGQPPEPQNTLQQRELEAPDLQNNISSENAGAQMETMLQQEISGDISPSGSRLNVPLAGALENQILGDILLSQGMPSGSQGAHNSHMLPTQTSSQPIANSASGSLGARGGPVGSFLLPRRLTLQPLIQRAPGMPFPPREADPLQNEFEKIRKEVELADQTYDELKLRLKSECEREIKEMVAQIRMKFDGKLKEAEVEYNLKKNELNSNMNRVFMHKLLAAAFRHKCMDIKSASLKGGQRGVSPDLAQQLAMSSLARDFQRQTSIPSSHGLPPPTSRDSTIPLPRLQSIPPVVLNLQNCTPAALPINHASSHIPGVASRPLFNPVSRSGTSTVTNSTTPMMVGHTIPVEGARAISPHQQHPGPRAGPILPQLARDLTTHRVNLANNAPSLPAIHTTNQVLPSEAVASWIRNRVPGPSGSADFVCLSDED